MFELSELALEAQTSSSVQVYYIKLKWAYQRTCYLARQVLVHILAYGPMCCG